MKVTFRTRSGTFRYADSGGIDIPVYADNAGQALWSDTAPSDALSGPVIAEATGTMSQVVRKLVFVVQTGAAPADVAPPRPGGAALNANPLRVGLGLAGLGVALVLIAIPLGG